MHPCVCWREMEPLEALIRRGFSTLELSGSFLGSDLRSGEGSTIGRMAVQRGELAELGRWNVLAAFAAR